MTDLFGSQKQCLRIMGHGFVRDKSLLLRNLRNFAYFASLIVVVSAHWPTLNFAIYYIDNMELATAGLSIYFVNVLTLIKMITFIRYKWRFVALMAKLNAMYDERKYQKLINRFLEVFATPSVLLYVAAKNLNAKKILETFNRKAFLVAKVYQMSTCGTALFFMSNPVLKIIWSKIRNADIILDLPMPMRFPFDFETFPGYGFVYVYTGLVTFTVVMYAVATDGVFIIFAINLVSHLKILQQSFVENTFLKLQQDVDRDLKSYVQYHNLILDLYKELSKLYQPIVFGQFLMTSLQVCVIIYQLIKHFNSIQVLLINFIFLTAILLQLFIYCYGGELLKSESSMVATSTQLSSWYNLEPSHRGVLLLLILRSQREIIIKGGFYEASLANFMTIIKAGLSYLTLIQSIE